MKLLKTCCCCCSLRTGTIIIGSVSLFFSICFLCLIIVAIVGAQVVIDQISAKTDIGVNDDTNNPKGFFDNIKSLGIIALSVFAVLLSIVTITSILLIFGAAKGRMWFLLPWIAGASLTTAACIVKSFDGAIISSGGQILGVLAVLALQIYYLLVVISLFQELRKNRRREASNIGAVYSASTPRSQAQIVPNVPGKESVPNHY